VKLNKIRSGLYEVGRVLGDVNAAQKGKIGRRVARRAAGKATGRLFRRLFG
jgi:hypothetical protein